MQNSFAPFAYSFTSNAATVTATPAIKSGPVTNPVTIAPASYSYIEQLVIEHDLWHKNAFYTSNEQLYVLLQKCYGFYKGMEGDSKDAKAKRDGLVQYINLKNLNFNKGTHSLLKIVKCVFGVDRRRASAYGLALRTALTEGISVNDLPAYIRNAGGVEEVRRKSAKSESGTTEQKATLASNAVAKNNIAVIGSTQLGMSLDAANIGKNVVLIGTWQSDGSVVVNAVVQNDTAINSALTCYYNANKSAEKTKAAEGKAANDANATQQAIDEALNAD